MAEPAAGAASSGRQNGRPPATRAPWSSISCQDIADAAVWIVEAGGYEEMSTGSLADALGVAPMTGAAANLRRFLVTRHAAVHVYLRHSIVSTAAVERMDAVMGVLQRAWLDEATARSAYGALHTNTIGFSALEASRAQRVSGGGETGSLADGFLGSGVIESLKLSAPPVADAGRTQRTATRPALPTPMAATVHRLAGHRVTVPQPRLGIDVSLAGRPR